MDDEDSERARSSPPTNTTTFDVMGLKEPLHVNKAAAGTLFFVFFAIIPSPHTQHHTGFLLNNCNRELSIIDCQMLTYYDYVPLSHAHYGNYTHTYLYDVL